MEHRQAVIHARAGKPQPQHEGRADRPQRLVEIGGVLLGDHVLASRGDRGAPEIGKRIEIADHGLRHQARRKHPVAAAVGGHQNRGPAQRHRQDTGPDRPSTDQSHTIA